MKIKLVKLLIMLYLDDHNLSSEKTISKAFKGIKREFKITLKNIRDSIQQLHSEGFIESWEDHKNELRWNNTAKGRDYFRASSLIYLISSSDHARRKVNSTLYEWPSMMD